MDKCNTTTTSYRLLLQAPAKELQHSEIIGYYVGYKLTDKKMPFQYKTIPVQKIKGQPKEEMTLVLNNLEKFTRYSISIQAYNKIGTGPKNIPEVVAKTEEDGKRGGRKGERVNFYILFFSSELCEDYPGREVCSVEVCFSFYFSVKLEVNASLYQLYISVPTSAPSSLTCSPASSSRILVSWAALEEKLFNGESQGYAVYVRPLLEWSGGEDRVW